MKGQRGRGRRHLECPDKVRRGREQPLRETTLNDPKGLKVLRSKSNDAEGPKEWLPLRKSVADLTRRTELSQAANERYLEALGKVDVDAPLSVLTDKLCRPVGRSVKSARKNKR